MQEKQQLGKPFRVPTTDGKVVVEHFGNSSVHKGDFSLAHMIAPAGWRDAFQSAAFDEYLIVLRGRLQIEISATPVVVSQNESFHVPRLSRIRCSNPFDTECEYVALCLPAFSPAKVTREST
ncbi:MAG: cupin [Proteobacteria bacterium]|nr:cupin [Pseudomonadota bacterium]